MASEKQDERRHDLDALRVFSFATLIIYHTSLIYGTKRWWIHSTDTSRLVDLISLGSHPWRMSLLFFISGVVTASLLTKRSAAEIRRTRTKQLLFPFVFGVLFVVPPQIYVSPQNPIPDVSYWSFWTSYLISSMRLEHMWFLVYLWIYVFIWSLAFPRLTRRWPDLSASLARHLRGSGLLLVPIVFLSALRLGLYPVFGETLVITSDFYAHAVYFSMFMAGSLLVHERGFWQDVDRQRWISLGLATASLVALAVVFMLIPREEMSDGLVAAARIMRSIFQWCAILALLAFAGRLANRANRFVQHLNRSIMTYYIAHQTVIILVAHQFALAGSLDINSFVPIVIITALICALIAEAKTLATSRLRPIMLGTAQGR